MSETRVHVVQYPDCSNLTLRWTDPETGRVKRKSAKTANRKDALRAAAQWEAELASGRAQQTGGNLSWEQFRERYELEVVPGLAEKTGLKIGGVFNTVESILPGVAKGRLRDLNTDRLSALQTELRTAGRAESTIAGLSGPPEGRAAVGRRYGAHCRGAENEAPAAVEAVEWVNAHEGPAHHVGRA
ncbi:MAG: hypothetical protein NTW96_01185 [Planctomycetia bacterium]|nr:hypothetical protein [Planctomycetia bacterium]